MTSRGTFILACVGLLALVYLGGGLLSALIRPFVLFYRSLLVNF